jgi:hypothetical protein
MSSVYSVPDSTSSLLEDLRSQGDQINWLKDKFRILVSESIKSNEKINQLESTVTFLQSQLSTSFEEIRNYINKIVDRSEVEGQIKDLSLIVESIRSEINEVKFGINLNSNFSVQSFDEKLLSQSLDRINQVVSNLAKSRLSDVLMINEQLAKLDTRMVAMASNCCCQDENMSIHGKSIESLINNLKEKLSRLEIETLPDIEEALASRVRDLGDQMEMLRSDAKLFKEERQAIIDRTSLRDIKLSQIMSLTEQTKQLTEKSEASWLDVTARTAKMEGDLSAAHGEIAKLNAKLVNVGEVEERLEFLRAEARANCERVARQNAQECDRVRSDIEKLNILRDEFIRLQEEVRENTSKEQGSYSVIARKAVPAPSTRNDTSEEIVVTGSVISWTIKNLDKILLSPDQYPRMMLSPYFNINHFVRARLKLFPNGSDQCKRDGYCSFYLRCPGGTKIKFSLLVNGRVLETFECEYDTEKDKGRNEFCRLSDYLSSDGSILLAIEILEI